MSAANSSHLTEDHRPIHNKQIQLEWKETAVVFQQSLDVNKNNNHHPHPPQTHTTITLHTFNLCHYSRGRARSSSLCSALFVQLCVALWATAGTHEREGIWKREKKKKHIFTEHHYHCH